MSWTSKDFTIEDWEKWKLCQSYVYCGKEALGRGKTIYWLILGLVIGMVTMFVAVWYERQYLVMKALKQYFRDENGVFWSITLTGQRR